MHLPSLSQLAGVAFLAVVVLCILHKWWFRVKYDWHLIPGPPEYPLVGNLPQFLSWEKPQLHLKVTGWAKEYGKIFKVYLPGMGRVLYVTDPVQIQKQITGHGTHGLPKANLYKRFQKLFGKHRHDSVFTARKMDARWKETRKGTAKAFSAEALKSVFPLVLKKASELVTVVKSSPANEPVDFQPLLVRFALDTAGLAGYHIDFGALQNKNSPLFEALVYCSSEALASSVNPFRRFAKQLFPTGMLARECDKMYGQLYSEYDWILKELRGRGEPAADDRSLWACLMCLKDPETGTPLDDEFLCPEMATFIIAATDTTAHQAMWTLFAIAAFPEIQQKIAMEMQDKGVFHCLRNGGIERLTYPDITSLSYLTMVMKEAMRMFPSVAPGTVRTTARDGERVCGYRVPQNTKVCPTIHTLFNAPWLWENPERFIPERWSSKDRQQAQEGSVHSEKRGAPRNFWAFSDGPRDCIGQRLAMMELLSVVALLVASFEFRLADRMGGWDGAYSRQYNSIALAIDGGMWLHCHRRTDAA